MKHQTFSERLFDVANLFLLTLLGIATLYPFLFMMKLSFSLGGSMADLSLIPDQLTLSNYVKVLTDSAIVDGFLRTLLRTGLGTVLTVMACILTAYPLAKPYFPNRSFWTAFIVFTMFFSGGLIPIYLLVKSLGMMNSIWALLIPGLIPTFSMIIARNFFMSLPESLEESARIDGANEFVILFRIVVPISMPIIATLVLWTAVHHWNAWFDSLIYIANPKHQVLQVILRRIVLEGTKELVDTTSIGAEGVSSNPDTIKAATVMVATLPIILFYPFLQKYFVKGMLVGSLKG
ncbi:carbohydrate ABC transporter permease [Paenibacillus sp. YN15]|uniref:carbohydrate ABC transporter permease n=1 Tax=Paenibacillus sp. YN15 TaxID=1742774 RepID=UPI00215CF489|nr:carbohydrate ABC transporter permease [Paenibacillus sp. YN15]